MLRWTDGVSKAPDGSSVREIPQRCTWSTSTWISETGTAWQRAYNFELRIWNWSEQPLLLKEEIIDGNETGRMGLYLEWFHSIEHCIALAWLRRKPGSIAGVIRTLGRDLHARYLSWADGGDVEDDDEAGLLDGETWRPLRWYIGVVPCDEAYMISSRGRLRSPHTDKTTRGFWYNETRYAAVRNAGLVDLFRAARMLQYVKIAPRIAMAVSVVECGQDAEALARVAGVAIGSAWSYLTTAAKYVDASTLQRRVPRLVAIDLWSVLTSMHEERHPVLGASLTDLMQEVRERISSRGPFVRGEFQFEQLRLARMAIAANA